MLLQMAKKALPSLQLLPKSLTLMPKFFVTWGRIYESSSPGITSVAKALSILTPNSAFLLH
jgi:hypothetical protein